VSQDDNESQVSLKPTLEATVNRKSVTCNVTLGGQEVSQEVIMPGECFDVDNSLGDIHISFIKQRQTSK
jgi:hypothetical protein